MLVPTKKRSPIVGIPLICVQLYLIYNNSVNFDRKSRDYSESLTLDVCDAHGNVTGRIVAF